jgi:hypothetical protein
VTLLIHSSDLWYASTRDRRYDAEWHDRVDRTAMRMETVTGLRRVTLSNGSKAGSLFELKLRAWFASADEKDALWLWLPRCFW